MRLNKKNILTLLMLVLFLFSAAPQAHAETNTEMTCNGLTTCIAVVMYYIGPLLASKVAAVGAYFFSMMISLSLNSTAYALQFLTDGWQMVRDMANMAFIFILIYIAMVVMLEAETAGTIKTLAVVIIIALLVNFSFFFTRVVIDTGNILAVQFYNAVPMYSDPANKKSGLIDGTGFKDLSISIMGAGKIQTLLSQQMFDKLSKGENGTLLDLWGALGALTVIYFAVAAFLWMLFMSFISVGIKFLLRIVGLWFVLMASPLAFVARTMHKTEGYFKKWLSLLIQFSLYPAIFMFMFLMLTKFASAIMTTNAGSGGTGSIFNGIEGAVMSADPNTAITGAIASVGIRMGFIIALLYVSLRVADWVCTETSSLAATVSGVAGVGVGRAVQAGAASSAWAARQTVGRGAYAASRSQTVNRLAGKYALGGVLKNTLSTVGSAQMDVRNAPGASVLGKITTQSTGMKVDAGSPNYGKGGFAKQVSERQKTIKKRAEAMKGDAVDIQKAQDAFKKDYNQTHGTSYENKVEELTKRMEKAKKLAASLNDKARKTGGGTSVRYSNAAARASAVDQRASEELAKMQKSVEGAAKDQVKARDKENIGNFAKRLASRNLSNLGMPSFGSRLGAADAEKLVKGKTTEEEIIEHIKHLKDHDAHEEEGAAPAAKPASKPADAPKAAPKDDHGHH